MAVPKKRVSLTRRLKRRGNHKVSMLSMSICDNCKSTKVNHTICGTCGFYNGRTYENISKIASKTASKSRK